MLPPAQPDRGDRAVAAPFEAQTKNRSALSERRLSWWAIVNRNRRRAIVCGDGWNHRTLPTANLAARLGLGTEMKTIPVLKTLWSACRLPEQVNTRHNHQEESDGSDLKRECDHRVFAHA